MPHVAPRCARSGEQEAAASDLLVVFLDGFADARPAMADRMQDLLRNGSLNALDYLGFDCPREVSHHIRIGMRRKFGFQLKLQFFRLRQFFSSSEGAFVDCAAP